MFKDLEFIDLTHMVTKKMPTWSGSCGFHHEVKRDYDSGVRVLKYSLHASAGTHLDAPSHFYKEGLNVGDLCLKDLIVPFSLINVSSRCSQDLQITVEDIYFYEKKYGEILSKSFVIGFTGWQKFWKDPDKYRNIQEDGQMYFPTFSKEAAQLLLERDVVGIGIDTLSPDPANSDHPVHHLILGAGKYIVENLCELDKLPEKGGYVFILPIKIDIGTEACVRCIAAIKK